MDNLKFLALRRKFRKIKRSNIRNDISDFVSQLKRSNPRKWYGMAKNIGAVQQDIPDEELQIPQLAGLSPEQASEEIADFYALISNEYDPINMSLLPAFLPSMPSPFLQEYEVYLKLNKLKSTNSTHLLDITAKLRKEC